MNSQIHIHLTLQHTYLNLQIFEPISFFSRQKWDFTESSNDFGTPKNVDAQSFTICLSVAKDIHWALIPSYWSSRINNLVLVMVLST